MSKKNILNFKDFFKHRKEIDDYFGGEVFEFNFMSDDILTFR